MPTPVRPPRRHGAELERALLQAAREELAAVGYANLTMEGVAARAHTGKQVLYRRWHSRADLVIAAVRAQTGSIADHVPDTGTLRGDVLGVLAWAARRWHDFGPDTIHGVLADLPDLDPRTFVMMEDVMTTILKRAAARGEIATADLEPRVVTLPSTLIRHEMLLTTTPVTEQTCIDIVDHVFLPLVHAVAGPARGRPPG
ncbi:Transcriptional regulator [Nostocoides japonicum T1-X7]|uniref:Transcriptional regulator n=1 Tax=Nostocoides japonicum T1-X7 TaxID=1194083 RepID=A0A077LX03_9MICO|nr:TetR/AcrR family transcriptional regulator [Tetrasphaera japonica]CCH76470.1 Transcriptional regulator [Tetrasphaera japonica T1-X7]